MTDPQCNDPAPLTSLDVRGAEPDQALAEVMARLQTALQGRRGPRELSDLAVTAMLEHQGSYLEDVGTEAIRRARVERADIVSRAHIDEADRLVRSSGSGYRVALFNAVGGLLAGSGLGQLLPALTAPPSSPTGWLLIIVTLVPGSILLTLGLRRR